MAGSDDGDVGWYQMMKIMRELLLVSFALLALWSFPLDGCGGLNRNGGVGERIMVSV